MKLGMHTLLGMLVNNEMPKSRYMAAMSLPVSSILSDQTETWFPGVFKGAEIDYIIVFHVSAAAANLEVISRSNPKFYISKLFTVICNLVCICYLAC